MLERRIKPSLPTIPLPIFHICLNVMYLIHIKLQLNSVFKTYMYVARSIKTDCQLFIHNLCSFYAFVMLIYINQIVIIISRILMLCCRFSGQMNISKSVQFCTVLFSLVCKHYKSED